MISVVCPPRRTDQQGSGHYGASRGQRKHNGVDYACYPDSIVLSNVNGIVTKLGYPYASDLSYRYVQITCIETGLSHRYFYVEPAVNKGDHIKIGDAIGASQELHYSGIVQHIHYEIKDSDGNYVDPNSLEN